MSFCVYVTWCPLHMVQEDASFHIAGCDRRVRWAQEGSFFPARVLPSAAPSAHEHQPILQQYSSALRSALPVRDSDHLLPLGWGLGSGKGRTEGSSTTGKASPGMLDRLLPPGWGFHADKPAQKAPAGALDRLLPSRWGSLLGQAGAKGQGAAGGPSAGVTAKPRYRAPVPMPHLDRALARIRAWCAARVGPWGGRAPGSAGGASGPASTAQGRAPGPLARGAEWFGGTAAWGAGWAQGRAAAARSAAQEALARLRGVAGPELARRSAATADAPRDAVPRDAASAGAAARQAPTPAQAPPDSDEPAGTGGAAAPGAPDSPPASAHDSAPAPRTASVADERAADMEQPKQAPPAGAPDVGAPAMGAPRTLLRTALRPLLARLRAQAGQAEAWLARIASAAQGVSSRLAARAHAVTVRMAASVRARCAGLAGLLPGLRACGGWGPAAGAALAGALVLVGAGALLQCALGRARRWRWAAAAGEGCDAVGELCHAAEQRCGACCLRTRQTPKPHLW